MNLKDLKSSLEPDEQILAAASGGLARPGKAMIVTGVLAATTHGVVFGRRKSFGGYELTRFPYETIQSIAFELEHSSIMSTQGIVSLFANGQAYSVEQISVPPQGRAVADVASREIERRRGAPSTPAADEPEIVALLKALAQLHEAGVITDEEFSAKKRSLLA